MPDVYYYVRSEEVSNVIECGRKLSAFYDKEIIIENEKKLCFSALINPKDDSRLYQSDLFRCLKLQVNSDKCYVADRFVYETAWKTDPELYYKTIIPVENYMFGTYRFPECLVTTTILPDQVSLLDKRMDSPIIYTNSEELYIDNILQELKDKDAEVNDLLLYYFFDRLADMGKLDKIENADTATTVYKNEFGRTYCVKKPDIDKFCRQVQI